MLYKLTEHHFIAKSQNQYLKDLKALLKPNECIIILDFADNFSFVVQDTAQAFHWNNLHIIGIGLLHVLVTI